MASGSISSSGNPRAGASTCPQHAAAVPAAPEFLSLRTAVILLIAFVCGIVAGFLTFLANGNVPGAVIAGLGCYGMCTDRRAYAAQLADTA